MAADPAAAAEMVHRSGQRGVPVIVVDDQVVVGFDRPRLDQLLATRRVSRPRLGLSVADANQIAQKEGTAPVRGAYVGQVKPSSPGERAGLVKGDVIIEFAARPIQNADDLEIVLAALTEGQSAGLVFVRQGRRMQVQVTL